MKKANSLKKALFASVMSLVVCFTMLVGTTFAWFTDSVTNNVNQIVSGNLDVELHHTTDYSTDATAYEVVASNTALYDELVWVHGADSHLVTAWQPNVMSTEGFKIENKGSLPLKYKFSLNFANATETPAGKTLADVLVITVKDANGDVGTLTGEKVLKNFVYEGTLAAGQTYEFVANIAWNQSANDNDFNVAGGLKINIGVRLVATQLTDAAELPEYEGIVDLVSTPEQLVSAMQNNGTVVLTSNITLPDNFETMFAATRNGTSYTGEGFTGVLDGNGCTIYNAPNTLIGCLDGGTVKNLTVVASVGSSISTYASESSDSIGAVANLMYGGVIENVVVSGTVIGEKAVGGIVGRIIGDGTVKNCVNNATVTSTGSSDAAGGIVGKAYYTLTGKEMNIVGCTNNGVITSGYAAGGIAGFSASNIAHCKNNGEIFSTGASAGGIVGEQTNYGAITNNTNTADITITGAVGYAGGIVGWIRYQNNAGSYQLNEVVNVSGNYNTASSITSNHTAAGIIGTVHDQVIANRNYVSVETIAASGNISNAAGVIGNFGINQGLVLPTEVRFTITGNAVLVTTLEANNTYEYATNLESSKVEGNTSIATVNSVEELTTAIANGGAYILSADLDVDADTTLVVASGKVVTLDLNGHTISGESNVTGANRNMFTVKGTLNVYNGTITLKHTGENMAWNNSTNILDITAGGVVNVANAHLENLGGSDMAFVAHLNNWGTVTLNVSNSTLKSTYTAVRVFNSGYDMNNVTIYNSNVHGDNRAIWVHNYTEADFGAKYDAAAVEARLNFDFFNGTNTITAVKYATKEVVYGFTNAVYYDAQGSVVTL